MSTYGAVESALAEVEKAYERLGFLVEKANRKDSGPKARKLAEAASATAKRKRQAFLGVLQQYADAQLQAGMDMGRTGSSSVR